VWAGDPHEADHLATPSRSIPTRSAAVRHRVTTVRAILAIGLLTWAIRLKSAARRVDPLSVQFDRLAIEAGDATFALTFDPHLTVIAGVGKLERDGLIGELLGALGAGRSGVHLEITSDAGARYTVRRPGSGPHQVIDVASGQDATAEFTTADGTVNVLAKAGLSVEAASEGMRLTESDLTSRSEQEERILQLAHVDQARLWDVAAKVKDREAVVARSAAEIGEPEDAAIFAEIERRHAAFEAAQAEHDQARRVALLVGANAAVLACLLGLLWGPVATLPFLVLAAGLVAYSIMFWRRMDRARRQEDEAVEAAGAASYLTFQIHRVNGLLANDQHRRRMMRAAEDHRGALAEWELLAGQIPVDWALEHRGAIRQAAARLRDAMVVRNPMAAATTLESSTRADLAHALLHQLNRARSLGGGNESFPLLVDEPFGRIDDDAKAELLGLLLKSSAHQQVILLTEDEAIASWARTEALTGHLCLIEPAARRDGADGGDAHAVA
jgi:hypothetical protein